MPVQPIKADEVAKINYANTFAVKCVDGVVFAGPYELFESCKALKDQLALRESNEEPFEVQVDGNTMSHVMQFLHDFSANPYSAWKSPVEKDWWNTVDARVKAYVTNELGVANFPAGTGDADPVAECGTTIDVIRAAGRLECQPLLKLAAATFSFAMLDKSTKQLRKLWGISDDPAVNGMTPGLVAAVEKTNAHVKVLLDHFPFDIIAKAKEAEEKMRDPAPAAAAAAAAAAE